MFLMLLLYISSQTSFRTMVQQSQNDLFFFFLGEFISTLQSLLFKLSMAFFYINLICHNGFVFY